MDFRTPEVSTGCESAPTVIEYVARRHTSRPLAVFSAMTVPRAQRGVQQGPAPEIERRLAEWLDCRDADRLLATAGGIRTVRARTIAARGLVRAAHYVRTAAPAGDS
jgi:hypothetical protein